MIKLFTILLTCSLFVNSAFCQLVSTGHKIIDDIGKQSIQTGSLKRSAQNPTKCKKDTVEYPRWKGTAYYTVTVSDGRALGQLYATPKPVTLSGFSFYAFIASNPPSPKKLRLICNVYKAGLDSLPTGSALRSDTITIDSTFGGGLLTKIEKHATFKTPITLDSAYILTVESDSLNLNTGVVVNSYAAGDGMKENLNCGSISGVWYNGKNLNIGGVPFNSDILLHPHVSYSLGADFTMKSQCYNLNDSIKFTNLSTKNMAGSRMYNKYMIPRFNLGYYCNWWTTGDGTGYTFSVDHKVKYSQRQNYKIQLISTVYGYRGMEYGCSDTTQKWLYYKPDFPQVIGPANACIGGTANYTVVNADTGTVYEWYRKTSDATPFYTGKIYNKSPLTKSDTFYVRGNNHGCVSNFRTLILNVNAYPATLSVQNDSICAGSKANLKGFTNLGNVEWFETATSQTLLYTGNLFQTPVLSKDTSFFVQANNKGCIKSPRIQVNALVGSNFAPAPPTISNDTIICMASTSSLTLNASAGAGLTVRWFDESSGSGSIASGNTFSFSPVKREIRTYYADAYNGVCGSTRMPVVITIEDFPPVSKYSNDTICKGDSLIMHAELPFGEADWFDAASGGNLVYTGLRYALMTGSSGDYYIETRSGICSSTSRTKLNGTVYTFPTVNKLWGDTICAKNKATLKSKLTGPGTMHWYEYDTSNIELGNGLSYTTAVLNGSKNYYAQPEYKGCYGPRQIVSPQVKPVPVAAFTYTLYANSQSIKVTAVDATGSAIFWSFGDGSSSILSTVTHFYPDAGTYKVKLILTGKNGCQDSVIIPITIAASGIADIESLPLLLIYPNPVQEALVIESDQRSGFMNILIYSSTGALVMNKEVAIMDNHVNLPLSSLASGLYVIKVPGYRTMRFIKE